jgi:ankyrin repeat protein
VLRWNALHLVIHVQQHVVLEAAQLALDLDANLHVVDANGETAMHGAPYHCLTKLVQLLAGKGAKIEIWNKKNKCGCTPQSIAEGEGHPP